MTIAGILLAAGRGLRFGSDKRLQPLADGRPMARAAAEHLGSACDRLVIVVRSGSDELVAALEGIPGDIVSCSEADAGIGHTLAAGIRAAAQADAWLVALADMPFIEPASHRAVAAAMRTGASIAAAEFEGRRGHPVGFSARWFDALTALTGDQGARAILEAHRAEIVRCPVDDPGVLRDVDHPADLAAG